KNGKKKLQQIQDENCVYIQWDSRLKQILLFGNEMNVNRAKEDLQQFINQTKQHSEKIYPIPKGSVKVLIGKTGRGIQEIKEQCNLITLTINYQKSELFLCGSEKDIEKAIEIINEKLQHFNNKQDDDENVCKICYCDVTDGYILHNCSHEFCRTCLYHQLGSAIQNNTIPIKCAQCGEVLLLQDIKNLVSGTTLEKLFASSVNAYLAKNTSKYKFCPTPDCIFYEKDDSMKLRVCRECMKQHCITCGNDYHPGYKC